MAAEGDGTEAASVRHEGGCVCGAVRYRTQGLPLRVTVCHCTWCQRRTGSAFGIEPVFAREQIVDLSGTPTIYRHVSDISGRWLDVEFCATCGSNLGFTLEAVPEIRTRAAGSFDDPAWIDPADMEFRHVFARSARPWSRIPDDVQVWEAHFRT